MNKIVISAFSALVLTLSACSSDPCKYSRPCSGDTDPDAAEIAQGEAACKALRDEAKCGAKFTSYADCAKGQNVCTDNKLDATKTQEKLATTCKTQQEAFTACLLGQ